MAPCSQPLNQTLTEHDLFRTLKRLFVSFILDFHLCDSDHTSAFWHWGTQTSTIRVQGRCE